MIVQRVEKHRIKQKNEYYAMLCDFAHKSKNLYNHANFLVREEFIKNKKWLRYGELDKLLKTDLEFDNYKQMPTAQSAQQTLRLLEKDWKSFFTVIKDWSMHNKKRRIHRGLFVSNKGIRINADVNGAYQILKKVFPKAFVDGIEGVALHLIRVSVV